jgi:flagellar protein FliL
MSAAAPTATASDVVPAKKTGKKKLIIIVAAAVLLLLMAGGGAMFYLKKKAHAAAEGDDAPTAENAVVKPDLKHPPTFLPLDPFVVNLSDKDSDRYAQVGLTFEVADAHFAEEMKAFMPAIRNGILMILAHKSSKDLLDRAGKEQLAVEILRESSRTMGIDIDDPEPITDERADKASDKSADKADKNADAGDKDKPAATDDDADAKAKKAKPKVHKAPAEPNPIRHVHFSNFIVQ